MYIYAILQYCKIYKFVNLVSLINIFLNVARRREKERERKKIKSIKKYKLTPKNCFNHLDAKAFEIIYVITCVSINLSYSRQTNRRYESNNKLKKRRQRKEKWQTSYVWIIYALTKRLWSNLRYCNYICATISAITLEPTKARIFNESVYLTLVLIFALVLRHLPPHCSWHPRPYDSLLACLYTRLCIQTTRIFPGIYCSI